MSHLEAARRALEHPADFAYFGDLHEGDVLERAMLTALEGESA